MTWDEYKYLLETKYRLAAHLANMEPELAEKCRLHLKACFERGIQARVACSVRGRDEQDAAFAKGTSKAVFGKSAHNWTPCLGYDFVFLAENPHDKDLYDIATIPGSQEWEIVGALGEGVGLAWGGRWPTFPDRPHFGLPNWKARLTGRVPAP